MRRGCRLRGWGRLGSLILRRFGGGREEVVVVAFDGVADGSAPAVGVEGVDVLVLSQMDGLDEGLGKIGEGAGGARLDVTAGYADDEAAEGGGEIASGEVFAGEEKGEIAGEFIGGAGLGVFAGVVGAEVRMAGGAGSAATAAIREGKRTQGHAVLCRERGHKSLLRVEFWDLSGKKHRQECLCYKKGLKQKRPDWSRGVVLTKEIVPEW